MAIKKDFSYYRNILRTYLDKGLRRSGVPHNSLHFPAESPAFIGYLLAGFVLKPRYDFGEFEWSK